MYRRTLFAFPLIAAVAVHAQAQPSAAPASDPVVEGVVKVVEQIKLPALEAGVLVQEAVKEGAAVQKGQQIAKIDDRQQQIQKRGALSAYWAARKRYEDDIEIEYAKKAADVAEQDYKQILAANEKSKGAVTAVEERRALLDWQKMQLSIKKAVHDQEVARFEAATKLEEYYAADLAITRRTILAPFDGVVEELNRKQNEWVNPGDTILQLYRMDTVYVDGPVDLKLYDPKQLQGCKVEVEVEMANKRREKFTGSITKISDIIRGDDAYNVRAEVANRQEGNAWILRDKMAAIMTIHLNSAGPAPAGVTRVP